MSKLERKTQRAGQSNEKPTMLQLRQDVSDRCEAMGLGAGFVTVLLDQILTPYNPRMDQPVSVGVTGADNATRWHEPYREHVMHCLSVYGGLKQHERNTLIAGAEDGVHWRGEPIAQYIALCTEHDKRKRIGTDKYIERVKESLGKVGGSLL